MTKLEMLRLIFVDILIPIVTLILGFFGGKVYQVKIVQKKQENKKVNVNSNKSIGDMENSSIHELTGFIKQETVIKSSGENSQSAGRDIINGPTQ